MKTQFGDSSLYTNSWPCPYYRTIEHLRADNPQYSESSGSLCNYTLGDRLFINLDRGMGHPAFTAGFRNLHRRLSTYEQDEIDQGLSVMRAFCPQCLTLNARLGEAGHTLARWYGEKILTDTSAATGTIAGLGSSPSVSIRDYGHNSRQYGISEVSASSPDQRRWARLYFSNASNPPETVRVAVHQYHEERYPYYSRWQNLTVYQSESSPAAVVPRVPGQPAPSGHRPPLGARVQRESGEGGRGGVSGGAIAVDDAQKNRLIPVDPVSLERGVLPYPITTMPHSSFRWIRDKEHERVSMKYIACGIILLGVAAFVIFGVRGGGVVHALGSGSLPTPGNFKAVNGPNAGEAVLTWDAVNGANFYRVGWITVDDATRAVDGELDIFDFYVFADISGVTTYTVTGLEPRQGILLYRGQH